jgi:hypothetical protein
LADAEIQVIPRASEKAIAHFRLMAVNYLIFSFQFGLDTLLQFITFGMRGFGHGKGNKVFPGSHGGHKQDQVAKSHARSAGAGATRETSLPQPRFGGLRLILETEPEQPR